MKLLFPPARGMTAFFFGLVALSFPCSLFSQGSLTPPAPPGPTMQTLAQIGAKADQANTKLTALDAKAEKRTPISSLPFKITSSGSYYVTGNLTGVSGNNGITITASGAAIDLNGFGLYGIAGAKVGVLILGGAKGTAVYNGRLSGWPEGGILARDAAASLPAIGSRFSDLQLDSNGMKGLDSGYAAVVRDCVAMNNAETGFAIGRGSTVERCTATGHGGFAAFFTYFLNQGGGGGFGPSVFSACTASDNLGTGFSVDGSGLVNCAATNNQGDGFSVDSCALRGCVASLNSQTGILAENSTIEMCSADDNGSKGIASFQGTSVSNSVSSDNAQDGINLGTACTATGCTSFFNSGSGITLGTGSLATNCTTYNNTVDGIQAGDSCYVAHCTASSNSAGVHATGGSNRIESNNVSENGKGISVNGTVNLVYGNSARANTSNYTIKTGNRVGTIVVPPLSGAISSNSGAAGFGSTDPWANIAF